MRVVIFTKDNAHRAGYLVVKAFLSSTHEIIGVIAKKASQDLLSSLTIPLFEFDDHNSKECEVKLQELKPDLIVIADDVILTPNIYTTSSLPAINFHPGILPWYRGSNTIFHALNNKEFDKVGFTIHEVEENVDTGDILYREVIEVQKEDTVETILQRCQEKAAVQLVEIAHQLEQGKIKTIKQDLSLGTLYSKAKTS